MYRSFLTGFLILICFISFAQHRKPLFGAYAYGGFVTSQVQGDALAGFDKSGLTGGLGITTIRNKKWGLGFELAFVQKGSQKKPNPDYDDYTTYKMALQYLEVPVLLQYHRKKLSFFAGPTFGVLVGSKEYINGDLIPNPAPFNPVEFGAALGVAYSFHQHWDVSMRTQESIGSIRATPNNYAKGFLGRYSGQYNTVLNLVLVYRFR